MPMTVERRLVVGLGDIRAVTFECKSCSARLTLAPDKVDPDGLTRCPSCGTTWWTTPTSGKVMTPNSRIFTFLSAIGPMRELQAEIGFTLLLEFDEPPHA